MSSFNEQMDAFMSQLDSVANLSIDSKEKITKAGAEVFKKALQRETEARHFQFIRNSKSPHLSSDIDIQKGDRDGEKLGSQLVGWSDKTAYIANFIENGTRVPMIKRSKTGKRYRTRKGGAVAIRRDSFVSEVQTDDAVNKQMIKKMNEVYMHEINHE